jgi:hypothetical protein
MKASVAGPSAGCHLAERDGYIPDRQDLWADPVREHWARFLEDALPAYYNPAIPLG